MNCALLCEGETDQIVLSEYFINRFNFRYSGKMKGVFSTRGFHYQNNSHTLDIIFSQGHEFVKDLATILDINKKNAGKIYDRLIIVTDRDSEQELKSVWKNVIEKFNKFMLTEVPIQENQWLSARQALAFDEEIEVSLLLIAIPVDGEGALETFLLDALRKEKGNSYLIDKSTQFVDKIIGEKDSINDAIKFNPKYLKERRMQVKAPLAVFFALAWPDRSFADLQDMLKRVPWDEYAEIQKSFQEFDVLR